MLKTIAAIMVAATIAATITVLSAPITDVVASPLPQARRRRHHSLQATSLALPQLRRHRIRQSARSPGQLRPTGPLAPYPGPHFGARLSSGHTVLRRAHHAPGRSRCRCAAVGGVRLRAGLSEPADPHHRADARRRPGRCDGAACSPMRCRRCSGRTCSSRTSPAPATPSARARPPPPIPTATR